MRSISTVLAELVSQQAGNSVLLVGNSIISLAGLGALTLMFQDASPPSLFSGALVLFGLASIGCGCIADIVSGPKISKGSKHRP